MASTVITRKTNPVVPGAERYTLTEVTFASSYATGGDVVSAAQLGLTNVTLAIATLKTAGTGSVTAVWYDIANGKLKAFVAAAEVTSTTDISAVTAQIVAFGS